MKRVQFEYTIIDSLIDITIVADVVLSTGDVMIRRVWVSADERLEIEPSVIARDHRLDGDIAKAAFEAAESESEAA